jgi:hypothetical protein
VRRVCTVRGQLVTPARRATLRERYSGLATLAARDVLECLDALDAAAEEPTTSPATPVAKRRSSDQLAAVRLPEPGLAARVAEELAKGRPEGG